MSAKYKRVSPRSQDKRARSQQVLMGLIELYVQSGEPVGSHQLQREGFAHLSSATIRNYLSELEELGLLQQEYASAGRSPTELGLRLYAQHGAEHPCFDPTDQAQLTELRQRDGKDVGTFLQTVMEIVSRCSGCVAFALSPRFDQDFVQDIRLVGIDEHRVLVVLITEFGFVHSELIQVSLNPGFLGLKRIEQTIQARLRGHEAPIQLQMEERQVAQQLYDEALMRHFVRYAQFWEEEISYTGVARLLQFPEFADMRALGAGIALIDHPRALRSLLHRCLHAERAHFWLGSDLPLEATGCAVLSIPYGMQGRTLGAIGLLGPVRLPYPRLMGLLQGAAEVIHAVLTKSLYKHRISYRPPEPHKLYFPIQEHLIHEVVRTMHADLSHEDSHD